MSMSEGELPATIRPLDIIAADDTRSQRWLLQTMLSAGGHRIQVAADGEQAFQLAAACPPDLLITDLEMPGCNGFDLIRAIRQAEDQRLRRIPIIVCSSRGETFMLNQALDCGATCFVTKPLHRSELQIAIDNLEPKQHCSHTR